MAEPQTHTSSQSAFRLLLDGGELAALGKKRIGDFMRMQTEFLDEIQEVNRHWLERFESEANLASEFASKLSLARSVPDALAVSREWVTQYFSMLAEDGQHLADDARKFVETGAKLFVHSAADEQLAANL
jgi:Phasin protein